MKRISLISGSGLALAVLLVQLLSAQLTSAEPADLTFTVDTPLDLVDSTPNNGLCNTTIGKCSLRAAVQEANIQSNAHGGKYTILLATSPITLSLTGANEDQAATGDLDISAHLTISPSAGFVIIQTSPAFNDRIFDVQSNGSLTLIQTAVRGGRAVGYGGGIASSGPVTLLNATVQSNTITSTGGANGAGIFASGPLTLVNSIVDSNRASGVQVLGGGIYAVMRLVIDRSIVTRNTVSVDGNNAVGVGGGLFSVGAFSSAFVTGSVIANNVVTVTTENGVGSASGGGIGFEGAYTITNSSVNSNRLGRPVNVGANGGGIWSSNHGVFISDTISANSGADYGGGLYAERGSVDVQRSTFSNNSTYKGPGGGAYVVTGTLTVRDSTFSGNQGATGGGARTAPNATLDIARSVFYLNNAAYGGGIENFGILTFTNSTLFLNESGSDGAGLSNHGTAYLNSATLAANIAQYPSATFPGDGGGIWNDASGAVYLRNSVLDNADVGGEAPDCKGSLNVLDYNLIHNTAGCTLLGNVGQHNITGFSAGLNFLANNGGPTLTSAPNANSPLIEAGNPGGCVDANGALLLTDQRGYPRTADSDRNGVARCDIGAYETELELYLPTIRR